MTKHPHWSEQPAPKPDLNAQIEALRVQIAALSTAVEALSRVIAKQMPPPPLDLRGYVLPLGPATADSSPPPSARGYFTAKLAPERRVSDIINGMWRNAQERS